MSRSLPAAILAFASLATLTACGDDDPAAPDAGGDDDDDDDATDAAARPDGGATDDPGYQPDRIGQILFLEYLEATPGAGAFLRDRPSRPLEQVIARAGDCAIYGHEERGECRPACDNGFCSADGECLPFPSSIGAGELTVTGLLTPLRFVPSKFGYTPEPYPTGDLFADDAEITVTAAGGDLEAFTVAAGGIAPLAFEPGDWLLVDGEDFPVSWTAAPGDARIQLALRTGWHGAPFERMLLCETADDGELAIPGELIAQMPPFGGAGLFPHPSEITRYRRGVTATSAGAIELFVSTSAGVNWTHE